MPRPANTVFLYGEPGDYANYRLALEAVGLRPVVSRSLMAALACGGLLLPGGGDIHGALPPEETFLLRAFWEAHRPILGICRGMQALSVFRGGALLDGMDELITSRYETIAKPKPGVLEFLERMRRKGVKMAIATLTARRHAERHYPA